MKNKLVIILLSCTLASGALFLVANAKGSTKNDSTNETHKVLSEEDKQILESIQIPKNTTSINVSYSDGSNSIEELKEKSILVVKGKLISQEKQSAIGLVSKVQVVETLRGKKLKEIYIY